MPLTNKWLCLYAIAQIGRPYWYGTWGQLATKEVYASCVTTNGYTYSDYQSQLNIKVHDCAGLVLGALMCDNVNGEPKGTMPIYHGSTSQFYYDCNVTSNTLDDFPYTPGTLVFISSGGTKTHVGIYIGNFIDSSGEFHEDIVVEAKGHDYGVVTSNVHNSVWDSWGQLECCTIDTSKGQVFDARTIVVSTGSVSINAKNTKPFVATLPPDASSSPNYDKLKGARVSAMMFYGGELYDNSHYKKIYMNVNLPTLVKECNASGMPFGLYVNVRAKNDIEADEECRALYYILAHYPPILGIWLSLKTNNTKSANNSILEVYYKYIDKWGLGQRCGLYIDEYKLSTIDWTSFQDRFYLWLIKPMVASSVDDELLNPSMFEVPE